MTDPHSVCSFGARNCSNCFSLCTDDHPCICCGGEEDALEWEEVAEDTDESPDFLLAEVERLTAALADRDQRIAEALAMHRDVLRMESLRCYCCGTSYPCATVVALRGES